MDPDFEIRGEGWGGAVIQTLRLEVGLSPKKFLWALWASVWSRNKVEGGGGGPRAPPLDPPPLLDPLQVLVMVILFIDDISFRYIHIQV